MGGDCPPPCVDFSFDCIDQKKAVLFGGYQPESGASSGAYILDMDTWVSKINTGRAFTCLSCHLP